MKSICGIALPRIRKPHRARGPRRIRPSASADARPKLSSSPNIHSTPVRVNRDVPARESCARQRSSARRAIARADWTRTEVALMMRVSPPGARARMTRAPGIDERHARAAAQELERRPAAEGAGADDHRFQPSREAGGHDAIRRPSRRRREAVRRPRRRQAGSGVSGGSCDRSCSQAKKRTNGRRCGGDVIADRAAQHRIGRAPAPSSTAPSVTAPVDVEPHLAADAGQRPQMRRQHDANHGRRLHLDRQDRRQVAHDRRPVCRRRSAEPYTCPPVVPK